MTWGSFARLSGLPGWTLGLLLIGACDSGAGPVPGDGSGPVPASPAPVRVLLIGIDGASFAVMDPLFARGDLPTLKGIADRGVRSVLLSQKPIFSPCIWTTIATGKNRAEHGIQGFISRRSTRADPLLVSTADRRAPALWNIATSAGRSVGVIGWWVSWPAEAVRGFVVSDRLAHGRWESWTDGRQSGHFTYPEELLTRVRPLVVDPVRSPPLDEIAALAEFSEEELAELARADHPIPFHGPSVLKFGYCEQRTYEKVALELLGEGLPDLSLVFLVAVDPVCHTFWHFYQPEKFPDGVAAEDAARLGGLVPALYRHDDAFLARLLAGVGPDTVVIVVSDHGFKASGKLPGETQRVDYKSVGLARVEELDEPTNVGTTGVHDLEGVLLACGGPIVRGAVPRTTPSVLDVAPTVLALLGLPIARDMPGRVLEELIDPAFLAAHPLRFVDSYQGLAGTAPPASSAADEADGARAEQLRSLGYVEFEER